MSRNYPATMRATVCRLPVPGWEPEQRESWLAMSWSPRAVSGRAEPVGADDVVDRVLVQRSAFANSTFTIERENRDWIRPRRA
jgi:hypothetical protein